MSRPHAMLLVLAGTVAACAGTWAEFRPYSAQTVRQSKEVNYPVIAYDGDIKALVAAGGFPLGTIQVHGNGFAGEGDVARRAMIEAANRGGTHVVLAARSSSTSWAQVTPDTSRTTFRGNTATTTYQPGTQIPIVRHQAGYVVVRVPVESWHLLPGPLQPILGRHYLRPKQVLVKRRGPPAELAPVAALTPAILSRAPDHDAHWFCGTEASQCHRTRAECEAVQVQAEPSSCRMAETASCFSYGDTSGPTLSCHLDLASCRSARDSRFAGGATILRECTPSE